jgi:hypothetical protein
MTGPEEGISRARAEAARKRAAGGYPPSDARRALDPTIVPERPPDELLGEWAVIAVEDSALYSTRRWGAPVTALKKLLIRLLRQYFVEAEAKQTRFNLAMLDRYQELERRIEALERRADGE